jgi:hypothetical protein
MGITSMATTNIDTFITELNAVKTSLSADLVAYNNLVSYSILPVEIYTIVSAANVTKSKANELVIEVIDNLTKLRDSGYPYPDVPLITEAQKLAAKTNVSNLSQQLNKIINKL